MHHFALLILNSVQYHFLKLLFDDINIQHVLKQHTAMYMGKVSVYDIVPQDINFITDVFEYNSYEQAVKSLEVIKSLQLLEDIRKRPQEIMDYLLYHQCQSFIVIDDMKLNWGQLSKHLIQTVSYYGLTKELVNKAIKLLNEKE